MYNSPYTVQLLHEDRVREALRNYNRNRIVYDYSEPVPFEYEDGLIYRVKQLFHARTERPHQEQETADVRRAHAI